MISDLETLKNKLRHDLASGFMLESRTVLERLQNIQDYVSLIPFFDDKKSTWKPFWFAEFTNVASPPENALKTVRALAKIYQDPTLAEKNLPVQQTFLLALLQLLETPTLLLNTVPDRHRALYYRSLLQFSPHKSRPDTVVVNFTLQKNITDYLLPARTALDAGQDTAGNALVYLTDSDLMITPQQIKQLYWTRQENDQLLLFKALDEENKINLPENGIRLFSQIEKKSVLAEKPQIKQILIDYPLGTLTGDHKIFIKRKSNFIKDATVSLKEGDNFIEMPHFVTKDYEYRLLDLEGVFLLKEEALLEARKNFSDLSKTPFLAISFPASQDNDFLFENGVIIDNCREISFFNDISSGKKLDVPGYPFGEKPGEPEALNVVLPKSLAIPGGHLTLHLKWDNLPKESFADFFRGTRNAPINNNELIVSISIVNPKGSKALLNNQALFLEGKGIPLSVPLEIDIPKTLDQSADVVIKIEIADGSVLRSTPPSDNKKWMPHVKNIDTSIQFKPAPFNEISVIQDKNQTLYLGLTDVSPGDNVSLYWSLQSHTKLPLSWSYFSEEKKWKSLENAVQDNTHGLSKSGLLRITLPEDSVKGGDFKEFFDKSYWIKAVSTGDAPDAEQEKPKLLAIMAGAVTATLNTNTAVDITHFTQPLAAQTIKQLVDPISEISRINQPFPSWGGKPQETKNEMFTRAAKRIAHRQRAITWGDMRSLLMENYPQIFDVKFLDVEKLKRIPASPEQHFLVLPDGHYREYDDPVRPSFSQGQLESMETWLKQFASPWATPKLLNPEYIDVSAYYRVIFSPNINASWGYHQLNELLQKYSLPWAKTKNTAVTPGNHLNAYQLLSILQQSPLVERVISFSLKIENKKPSLKDVNEINHQKCQKIITAKENEVLILIPESDKTCVNGEPHV